jgi:DNA-binding response OmpR family regulator
MFGIFGSKKKANGAKILIVEDEPDLAQTVQDRLEMAGYNVIRAGHRREA